MKTKLMIAAVVSLFATSGLQADDNYILTTISNRVVPALNAGRFEIQDTALTELLGDGETQTFTITPCYGSRVKLVAVGDWDSNDVDMYVYGAESGRRVACDPSVGDIPVCEFTSRGGAYKVVVKVIDTDCPSWVRLVYATR